MLDPSINRIVRKTADEDGFEATRRIPNTEVDAGIAAAVSQRGLDLEDDAVAPGERSISCPHCETSYLYRPEMLNKPIRCRQCKGVFRVFPDQRTAPAIGNRMLPESIGGLPGRSVAPPKPVATRVAKTNDLVKAMSSSLADIIGTDAGFLDRMAERKVAAEMRTAQARTLSQAVEVQNADGPVYHIDPVLTDSGRQSRRRTLLAASLFFLAACGIGFGLYFTRTPCPERLALIDFVDGVTAQSDRSAEFINMMKARAWPSRARVQPVIGLGRARFIGAGSASLASLSTAAEVIRNRKPIPGLRIWVEPSLSDSIQLDWLRWNQSRQGTRSLFLAQLEADEISWVDEPTLKEALERTAAPRQARKAFSVILQDDQGDNQLAARFRKGDVPDQVHWTSFRGDRGLLLLPDGSRQVRAYTGLLVRFEGEGWPDEWRVLTLEAKDGPQRSPR
jgi:hypothetical protein